MSLKTHSLFLLILIGAVSCANNNCKFDDSNKASEYIIQRFYDNDKQNRNVHYRDISTPPYRILNIDNNYKKYKGARDKFLYGSTSADIVDSNGVLVWRVRLYSDCEFEWLTPNKF